MSAGLALAQELGADTAAYVKDKQTAGRNNVRRARCV
jgi:hypothetical protein